jgi:hypothetical protein
MFNYYKYHPINFDIISNKCYTLYGGILMNKKFQKIMTYIMLIAILGSTVAIVVSYFGY